jgi:membrane protein insertase Oxa1/YidC/SpoIIIJ
MIWWEIALATITMRSASTLPLSIYSLRHQFRLMNAYPLMQLAKQQAAGDQHLAATKIRAIMRANRIRPLTAFISPLTQIPIFLGFSQYIRRECGYALFSSEQVYPPSTDLITGGFGLWQNLLLTDPTLFSPLLLSALHLMNLHVRKCNV